MQSGSAARRAAGARDCIAPLGLSPAELALVRTAAAGKYEVIARPVAVVEANRHGVVRVAALRWWEMMRTNPAHETALATSRWFSCFRLTRTPSASAELRDTHLARSSSSWQGQIP